MRSPIGAKATATIRTTIWTNRHLLDEPRRQLMVAWGAVWRRHQDEPSVFGYDLLNEPQRGLDTDYDRCQREKLLPLLRRLTDAMHAIRRPG